MDRISPWVTGAALALSAAVVYVLCSLASSLFPERFLDLANLWAHAIDLRLIRRPAAEAVTLGQWALGFAAAFAAGFLGGTLYGWARNLFARRPA